MRKPSIQKKELAGLGIVAAVSLLASSDFSVDKMDKHVYLLFVLSCSVSVSLAACMLLHDAIEKHRKLAIIFALVLAVIAVLIREYVAPEGKCPCKLVLDILSVSSVLLAVMTVSRDSKKKSGSGSLLLAGSIDSRLGAESMTNLSLSPKIAVMVSEYTNAIIKHLRHGKSDVSIIRGIMHNIDTQERLSDEEKDTLKIAIFGINDIKNNESFVDDLNTAKLVMNLRIAEYVTAKLYVSSGEGQPDDIMKEAKTEIEHLISSYKTTLEEQLQKQRKEKIENELSDADKKDIHEWVRIVSENKEKNIKEMIDNVVKSMLYPQIADLFFTDAVKEHMREEYDKGVKIPVEETHKEESNDDEPYSASL